MTMMIIIIKWRERKSFPNEMKSPPVSYIKNVVAVQCFNFKLQYIQIEAHFFFDSHFFSISMTYTHTHTHLLLLSKEKFIWLSLIEWSSLGWVTHTHTHTSKVTKNFVVKINKKKHKTKMMRFFLFLVNCLLHHVSSQLYQIFIICKTHTELHSYKKGYNEYEWFELTLKTKTKNRPKNSIW